MTPQQASMRYLVPASTTMAMMHARMLRKLTAAQSLAGRCGWSFAYARHMIRKGRQS